MPLSTLSYAGETNLNLAWKMEENVDSNSTALIFNTRTEHDALRERGSCKFWQSFRAELEGLVEKRGEASNRQDLLEEVKKPHERRAL